MPYLTCRLSTPHLHTGCQMERKQKQKDCKQILSLCFPGHVLSSHWFQPSSSGAGWVAADSVPPQPGACGHLLSSLRYLAAYLLLPLSHRLASFAVPEGSLLTWSFPHTAPRTCHCLPEGSPREGSAPRSIGSFPSFPARTRQAHGLLCCQAAPLDRNTTGCMQ